MQKKPQQPKRKTLPKGRCSQFEHSYTASCTPESSNGTSEMYDKEASIKFFNKALRTGDLKEVQNPISTYTVHGVTPKNIGIIRSSLNLGGIWKYIKLILYGEKISI